MKIHSWYVTLGILGASALATGACTVTTTSNGGDGGMDDGAATGTDTGTTVVPEGGDGADTCGVALDTGSAACDSCTASCCTQLTTCATPDDAGVDDAGSSACLQLLFCINDVNNASDAGVDAGVGEATCETPMYTADEKSNAQAVLSCIRTNCAAQCPGL